MNLAATMVLFVGSDEAKPHFRQELTRRIEQLGVAGMFHIVGDCKDMPAALMLADVVVSASTEPEGFGRVIIEAQARGRPVIATDHGGARETVLAGETGWLVPPGDRTLLAAALTEALALTLDQRRALAGRAREWIEERYDTRLMCQATLGVYEELLFQENSGRNMPAPGPILARDRRAPRAHSDWSSAACLATCEPIGRSPRAARVAIDRGST